MSSGGKNGTGEGEPSRHPPVGTPSVADLRLWMSALVDGELGPRETELLAAALERDPALLSELDAELDAFRPSDAVLEGAALGGDGRGGGGASATLAIVAGPVDVADAVLAAVAPEGVAATALGAARLASLDLDAELVDRGRLHLDNLLGASSPAELEMLGGFVSTVDAARALGEAAPEHASIAGILAPVADATFAATQGDLAAFELACLTVDGEATQSDASTLQNLLESPAHGAYRQAGLLQLAAMSEALQTGLHEMAAAPEAARAGAAALQAISASAELSRQGEQREPARSRPGGLLAWLREQRDFLVPMVFAGAATAVFLVIGNPDELPADGPPDEVASGEVPLDAFLHQVDQELGSELGAQQVALDQALPLLSDNHSEVLSIDTSSQATLVFETEASSITVIWVSEASPDDDESSEEAKGT